MEAWLNRGAAMMPPTASQRRPAMVLRWLGLKEVYAENRFRVSSDTFHVAASLL